MGSSGPGSPSMLTFNVWPLSSCWITQLLNRLYFIFCVEESIPFNKSGTALIVSSRFLSLMDRKFKKSIIHVCLREDGFKPANRVRQANQNGAGFYIFFGTVQ